MATKTTTKVAPLADRVVVRALEESETMRGGLYIPDTAKEKPQQGEIIAVGPGQDEDGTPAPLGVTRGGRAGGGEALRGGLCPPATAKEKPQQGEIIAVGPGKYEDGKLVPMGVKVGD